MANQAPRRNPAPENPTWLRAKWRCTLENLPGRYRATKLARGWMRKRTNWKRVLWRSTGNVRRREKKGRVILDKMRHDGCSGRPSKAELLTGIEGASSRPVRRIVLREG